MKVQLLYVGAVAAIGKAAGQRAEANKLDSTPPAPSAIAAKGKQLHQLGDRTNTCGLQQGHTIHSLMHTRALQKKCHPPTSSRNASSMFLKRAKSESCDARSLSSWAVRLARFMSIRYTTWDVQQYGSTSMPRYSSTASQVSAAAGKAVHVCARVLVHCTTPRRACHHTQEQKLRNVQQQNRKILHRTASRTLSDSNVSLAVTLSTTAR